MSEKTVREKLLDAAEKLIGKYWVPDGLWESVGLPSDSDPWKVAGATDEDWDAFDHAVTLCPCCNYWFHPCDTNDAGYCQECIDLLN